MILISAGDALSAKLIKEAGYDGVWVSGFEATARLGLPDNGSITLTEMLNIAKPIVDNVDIPVYVDVDTGYSNFRRTVKEFENIGVAGVCIEDVEPEYKRNSLWGDKVPLMDIDKFKRKLDIKRNIHVIARTEALIRGYGVEETEKRMGSYHFAGADYVFPHSRTKPMDLDLFPAHSKIVIAPTKFPDYTNKELKAMGYSMIIWANQTERVKIKAVRDMLHLLSKHDRMLEAEQHLCATLDDMRGLMPDE